MKCHATNIGKKQGGRKVLSGYEEKIKNDANSKEVGKVWSLDHLKNVCYERIKP